MSSICTPKRRSAWRRAVQRARRVGRQAAAHQVFQPFGCRARRRAASTQPRASSHRAAPSSGERGTWPRRRASSRRFGVACSVRSATSFSAMLEVPRLSAAPVDWPEAHRVSCASATRSMKFCCSRQPTKDHQQADDQRDREADGEQVQARRGAAHDAEGEVDHQQRSHAGQRHFTAPRNSWLAKSSTNQAQVSGRIRRCRPAGRGSLYQRLQDQLQVAVQRHERQRDRASGRAGPPPRSMPPRMRVDVEGERQAHAVASRLAAEADRVEYDLQHEADGDADEHLLAVMSMPPTGEQADRGGAGSSGAASSVTAAAADPEPCGHEAWRRRSARPSSTPRCARTARSGRESRLQLRFGRSRSGQPIRLGMLSNSSACS
jgi:hypothetical protein